MHRNPQNSEHRRQGLGGRQGPEDTLYSRSKGIFLAASFGRTGIAAELTAAIAFIVAAERVLFAHDASPKKSQNEGSATYYVSLREMTHKPLQQLARRSRFFRA